jgi:Cu(I)/Ag(I) efflux system membrane protein CusA/SilA
MIAGIIRWSIRNRFLVLVLTGLVTAWGLYSLRETPVDALPDLSDVQVIIKTSFPGQAPQVVEDQVTYPLTTAMLSVPKATTVRGYSFFGDSFVYIIFEDGTDLYWARSRVLEYLNQVSGSLPSNAKPALGPDATGVGWVFEYALVDRTGQHDLAQLRSLQDWFLKYELQTVPGVAEVATVGGMVRQYQVVVDPDKLRAFGIPLAKLKMAIQMGNQESGGSVIEMGEAEYMVRATGYIQGIEDLKLIPLGVNVQGTPLVLSDVAEIRIGPQMRRGIADLDGEGEVVGGIVIMRWGENALATIDRVKARLAELERSLPDGVEVVTTYDRSDLIHRAAARQADRRVPCRCAGVRRIPLPFAFLGRGHSQPAGWDSRGLHRHEIAGHQRQHHVIRRHCYRHRRHGGCGDRDDRERAQAHRKRAPHRREPLAHHG